MLMTLRPFLLSVLVLLTTAPGALAANISLGEKARLQAAMQTHIDRASVDGRFLHIDMAAGAVRALRPQSAHPMILRMGDYFVLCAEFEAQDGASVNVDFFVARRNKRFVVFDQQVENRDFIKGMMKVGKVERLH